MLSKFFTHQPQNVSPHHRSSRRQETEPPPPLLGRLLGVTTAKEGRERGSHVKTPAPEKQARGENAQARSLQGRTQLPTEGAQSEKSRLQRANSLHAWRLELAPARSQRSPAWGGGGASVSPAAASSAAPLQHRPPKATSSSSSPGNPIVPHWYPRGRRSQHRTAGTGPAAPTGSLLYPGHRRIADHNRRTAALLASAPLPAQQPPLGRASISESGGGGSGAHFRALRSGAPVQARPTRVSSRGGALQCNGPQAGLQCTRLLGVSPRPDSVAWLRGWQLHPATNLSLAMYGV